MSKLVTKLNMLGMNNRAKEFKRIGVILNVDDMYEDNKDLLSECVINEEKHLNSEEFMMAVTNQLYYENENPFILILGIQYACMVYGGIVNRMYSFNNNGKLVASEYYELAKMSQISRWLDYAAPVIDDRKLEQCKKTLAKIEYDYSIVYKRYVRVQKDKMNLEYMSDNDVKIYVNMIKFIRKQINYIDELSLNSMISMLKRNEKLVEML